MYIPKVKSYQRKINFHFRRSVPLKTKLQTSQIIDNLYGALEHNHFSNCSKKTEIVIFFAGKKDCINYIEVALQSRPIRPIISSSSEANHT